ncbi:ATP-dependent RNA helicase DHX30-like [Ceratina calcarata]|uniref:ATP-dependent RNA helicase DHX30-like n=1 Tax=Ceratina calcarata TaxID=156304 RepID=A0AAJ7NA34_9HYME|nr:ATP-dependent RNA helicase DHX30-like [Ceratina calcarata]
MLSHITCSARRSLHSNLASYCLTQIYRSRLKNQVTFYCSQSRNPKFNALSYNSFKKEAEENKEGEVTKFTQGNNKLDNIDSAIRERIKKLYTFPLADLRNIYNVVNNEFNKECMSVTYGTETRNRNRCTINITWPVETSFSEVATNKQSAAHNAALACLEWLHMNKRVSRKKPVLYDDKDIRHHLEDQGFVNINVAPEWKQELRSLIKDFDDRIEPVITASPIPEVEEESMEEENVSESNDDLSDMMSYKTNYMLSDYVHKKKTEDLPITRYREEILSSLANNQVIVIKGDTGCGKSTQVPQFIIDDYVEQGRGNECNIVVAEPRRISAVSLAHRVAWERNENVGDVVGYHVRFDNVLPQMGGSVLYCTAGILLRRLEYDPTLKGVTHIIIDEAHERSLQTDILLKFFKDLLKTQPHLKLIIMSASINAELFQEYFACSIIDVPGKTYPVEMHFIEDIPIFNKNQGNRSYSRDIEVPYDKVVQLIRWIIGTKPPGAILCFLPGWQEIKEMNNLLVNEGIRNLFIMSLHSKIPIKAQQKVFEPVPANKTKVILSTDIAETGITIKDISYVIDTAIKRQVEWNEFKFLSSLNFSYISQASICQRKGRAGRVKPGESYHLITKRQYEKLDPYPKPEILKIPLEEAIIISKTLKNEKAYDFFGEMIETPSKVSINHAISNLMRLSILDEDENLTSLGKRVSYFALHPKLSRAVVLSCIFQCLDPVLSIATVFSTAMGPSVSLDETESVNVVYKDQKKEYHKTSDHIAILQYYDSLQHAKNPSLFSFSNDTQQVKSTHAVKKLYLLHMNNLISAGMISSTFDYKNMNLYGKNNEIIRAMLFAGTNHLLKRNCYGYKNGCFMSNTNEFITEDGEKVKLKTESVNYNRRTWPSDTMTYINKMEFVKRHSCLITDTSMVSPLTVLLFSQGEACYEQMDNVSEGDAVISIDSISNVKLCCDKEAADLLLKFRSILWNVADFIIKYEGEKNEDNLSVVKSYKEKLMPVLSKMLLESSRDIEEESDDDEDSMKY